ncbi:hypothetical protein ACIBHX_49035 [Nonomuraea sp. NPDC050536]|uniref:hypothetical protein n=1 Tax=Nonomuraea sp. NPDC050536 TaxID=3364366 RepID=UPI0037C73357
MMDLTLRPCPHSASSRSAWPRSSPSTHVVNPRFTVGWLDYAQHAGFATRSYAWP